MTLTAAGFPGSVNDIQWSELLSLLGNDGTDGMNVAAASGDRTVSIGAGVSNVGGVLAKITGSETVGPLPTNGSSNTRIDRIVLRAIWSSRTLVCTYRQGTPSANPQPPTISHVRNPGVQYEVSLALIEVPPSQGPLNSGLITSTRTPPTTGFYRISSIATAPDPADNALIFYAPQNSLRVPIGGEYVEIAHGRDSMLPQFVESTSDFTFTNTSPSPTASISGSAPRLGIAFVAPPSGLVEIKMGARLSQTQNGGLAVCGWQLRTGSTIGSGSIVVDSNADRAVTIGEAVNAGAPARGNSSAPPYLRGLTPGSSYNVQLMHWVGGSPSNGECQYRSLVIEPK